jgi:O-antigen/teichoic acid export membrane protein
VTAEGTTLAAEAPRLSALDAERARRPLPVFRTIATVGAIQVLAMAFQLVRSKVVAVTLGPGGVGTISMVDQVAALVAQVATFSLPFAAVKFLSAAHSEGRQAFTDLYAAFLRALWWISLAGTAAGVALLAYRPTLLGHELAGYAGVAVLAMLAIPATNLIALVTNAMAAARHVHASATYALATTAALAVLCTAGVLVAGLSGYYAGNFAALAVVLVGGLVYLRRVESLPLAGRRVHLVRELRRYP